MNFRKFRGLAAVAVTAALVLSGCGSSDDKGDDQATTGTEDPAAPTEAPSEVTSEADAAILAAITFDADKANTQPTDVKFETPLGIKDAAATVLAEGTGETVEPGSIMEMHLLQYDAETGEQVISTYEEGEPQILLQGDPNIYPQLMTAFEGQQVGARVAFATPAQEGVPGVLFLMELSDIAPSEPNGEEIPTAEGDPVVTFDADGLPEIEIPKDFEVGSELQVIQLIKGDGPEVGPQAQVYANYSGWQASDGEKFDSSFDRGMPFGFSTAGGVIQGWMEGATGQTVGSRVLLVVPKDKAYGASPEHPLAEEDLIFVVDILAVEQ